MELIGSPQVCLTFIQLPNIVAFDYIDVCAPLADHSMVWSELVANFQPAGAVVRVLPLLPFVVAGWIVVVFGLILVLGSMVESGSEYMVRRYIVEQFVGFVKVAYMPVGFLIVGSFAIVQNSWVYRLSW